MSDDKGINCSVCRAWITGSAWVDGTDVTHASCVRGNVRKEPYYDPVPMRLHCPECLSLHLDVGEFATKPHHTHACQECGNVWRPAVVATVGVRFLPGFKNEAP